MIVRPSYSCPNVCRSLSKVRAGPVWQIIAGPVTKRGDGSVRRCGPPRRCVLRKARGSAARGVLCGDACGGRIGHFRLLAYWQRFCRSRESPSSSVILPSAPVSCQHRLRSISPSPANVCTPIRPRFRGPLRVRASVQLSCRGAAIVRIRHVAANKSTIGGSRRILCAIGA